MLCVNLVKMETCRWFGTAIIVPEVNSPSLSYTHGHNYSEMGQSGKAFTWCCGNKQTALICLRSHVLFPNSSLWSQLGTKWLPCLTLMDPTTVRSDEPFGTKWLPHNVGRWVDFPLGQWKNSCGFMKLVCRCSTQCYNQWLIYTQWFIYSDCCHGECDWQRSGFRNGFREKKHKWNLFSVSYRRETLQREGRDSRGSQGFGQTG